MKFVHAADLHIDSPLRGLTRYQGAPEARIRGATREALTRLVDLCIEEQAELLLLAGDLFDGNWRDYSTGLFFASQMSRLRAAGVAVVSLRGNHDAASQLTRHLRLPDNVVEFGSEAPATRVYDELGVAVHGQSFGRRGVTEDLAAGYPRALPGLFNIGLLHTALSGRPGHEPYAPTTLSTLLSKGYQYWALGHVHAREVVHEQPHVIFSGNLQGRHVREPGAKGATLVQLEDGALVRVEHRVLDVVRWSVCEVSVAGSETPEDAVDCVRRALEHEVEAAEGRLLCARVRLTGRAVAHAAFQRASERWLAEVRAVANDFGGDVWVEKVVFETEPDLEAERPRTGGGALSDLLAGIARARANPDELAELAAGLADIQRVLPAELAELDGLPDLSEPSFVASLLSDVEQQLLSRLLSHEVER